jgi:hypothetical protein
MNNRTKRFLYDEMPERRVCECGAIFYTYVDQKLCASCETDRAISAMDDKFQQKRDGD